MYIYITYTTQIHKTNVNKHIIYNIHKIYKIDPLKLGNILSGVTNEKDNEKVKRNKILIQTVEIFNGRVAMLATVGFAVQEFFTGYRLP